MVLPIVTALKVATARTVGDILYAKGGFKNAHSARVQAQKHLNFLSGTDQLIRGEGWYAVKGYRGKFKEHDRLLTQALSDILQLKYEAVIHREVAFEPGLRSDAAVLLKRGNEGLCFILEVMHNESPEYLQMKKSTWINWKGANAALSELFGYRIPHFSIVVSRNQEDDEFNQLIRRLT